MKKRLLSEKQQRDTLIFENIASFLKQEGFELLSKAALEKIYASIKLVPPSIQRTEDIKEKASFVLEKNKMIIQVNTGYNLEKKLFPKHGALSVIASDPINCPFEQERVFQREYKRTYASTPIKVQQLVEYLVEEIGYEHRPGIKSGGWATIVEITQDEFFWVHPKTHAIIKGLFDRAPKKSFVVKDQYKRSYYEGVSRGLLGIQKRRRDIKLPYKTE